ncbi:MAG: class I SAM-dependent methyltransferase [Treponema sp.]|nr:class I SAM-dependent methyltransferase [Spirochaetia bacterium]MDD7460103.1 class I SAM-dependent methyltransferase [Spirochaetales bacterium]MEE1182263.1 class I SAM-dependent methyltransferase [Treponema sp.]
MNKKKEWFEDENFWLNYGPIMFDEQQWSQAHGIAEKCIELAGLKNGDSILDVCCAVGRISIELASCGMNVTGVDITQPFLDAAKESADDEGVHLELINHDMRTFNSRKKFDAAVNIYNSFGYCDKIEDDIKILKQVYKNLKKGGTFILECISRESAIKYFTPGEWFERAGMTVLTEFTVSGAWEGLNSRWILIDKNGNKTDHTFVQRLYSAAELRNILIKECKFKTAEVYGGFNKENYDQNLSTMVIVCKK